MQRKLQRNKHWLLLSAVIIFALAAAPLWRAQAQSQPVSRAQAQSQSDDNFPDQMQNELQTPEPAQNQEQYQSAEQGQGDDLVQPAGYNAGSQDSHVRIVRISYVDGQVRIDHGSGYESATMNVPVTERNWLQTRSDGWAEVQFEDGSTVRLAPDTQIAFTRLGRASSGGTITTVDLDQGEAEFKIARRDGGDFQVTVKNKTIVLDQPSSFRVTSVNSDPLEVVVWKGEVAIHDPESGSDVAVKKNETFFLDPNDVGRYALDNSAEADSLDQWSKERDDYLRTYARNGNLRAPYQYGTSDLSNYGEYFDDGTYGTLWQPSGVNIGWDPFSNGYWAYSPGFGYTWVSSYPWGWLPFRYGRWIYINHRGWCWAPGGWDRWHTGPRWVNAPPGFRPPAPPSNERIVISGAPGGRVVRPGTPTDHGGAGVRSPGNVPGSAGGGRTLDHDSNGGPGSRGNRRVFTNDDVQSRVPRTDVPAQPEKPGASEHPGVIDANTRPKLVEQQPGQNAGGSRQRTDAGFRGSDREPPRVNHPVEATPPAGRSRASGPPPVEHAAPPPSQPVRQYSPPPAPVREYSPAPAQVHQSAPAAAPARQQAPAESHSRSDDSGSRSSRPK